MRYQKIVLNTLAAGAAGIVLAACGGGGGGGGSAGGSGTASTGAVSVRAVPGVGDALVDPSGKTLYFADQESGGQIHCTGACLQFWQPLKASGDSMPQAAGVPGNLATIHRPDGTTQVTYDGHPLYTFVEDSGAGKAKGNGFTDSFGGTTFLWHASTVSGAATPATPGSPTPGNGGGYGNGY